MHHPKTTSLTLPPFRAQLHQHCRIHNFALQMEAVRSARPPAFFPIRRHGEQLFDLCHPDFAGGRSIPGRRLCARDQVRPPHVAM
jgi:hypothetical protein